MLILPRNKANLPIMKINKTTIIKTKCRKIAKIRIHS